MTAQQLAGWLTDKRLRPICLTTHSPVLDLGSLPNRELCPPEDHGPD